MGGNYYCMDSSPAASPVCNLEYITLTDTCAQRSHVDPAACDTSTGVGPGVEWHLSAT